MGEKERENMGHESLGFMGVQSMDMDSGEMEMHVYSLVRWGGDRGVPGSGI